MGNPANIGQRTMISRGDIIMLNEKYGCKSTLAKTILMHSYKVIYSYLVLATFYLLNWVSQASIQMRMFRTPTLLANAGAENQQILYYTCFTQQTVKFMSSTKSYKKSTKAIKLQSGLY